MNDFNRPGPPVYDNPTSRSQRQREVGEHDLALDLTLKLRGRRAAGVVSAILALIAGLIAGAIAIWQKLG